MVRKYIVLSVLVALQVLGDVWLSRGMKQIGGSGSNPAALVAIGLQVLTNPWIMLGVLFLIGSLLLYLAAISRLDLSYVLPMTALKYVLSAFCAWLILGESVSPIRWWGTACVSSGVLLVALSEAAADQRVRRNQGQRSSLLLVPVSCLTLPNVGATLHPALIGIVVMALAASMGDVLLAAGMKQVGEVSIMRLRSLLALMRRALTNPFIGLGVLCMAADFFLFIALLSRVDLSLIMPMTALSYPFSLLGSHYVLKEKLTTGRLAGTGFIGVGVAFISLTATT